MFLFILLRKVTFIFFYFFLKKKEKKSILQAMVVTFAIQHLPMRKAILLCFIFVTSYQYKIIFHGGKFLQDLLNRPKNSKDTNKFSKRCQPKWAWSSFFSRSLPRKCFLLLVGFISPTTRCLNMRQVLRSHYFLWGFSLNSQCSITYPSSYPLANIYIWSNASPSELYWQ